MNAIGEQGEHLNRQYIEMVDRKGAAEILGVSLRTLDRLVAEGRLTTGRALRKTRPIVTFDEAELAHLNEERGLSARSSTSAVKQLALPDSIGFRLDPYYVNLLRERGLSAGQSPGEHARTLVIRALEDTAGDRFVHEARRLREGLAETFYAFLTLHCNIEEKEAEKFVQDTILRK